MVFSVVRVELYDPVTGNWTYSGDMFEEFQQHTTSLLNNGNVLVSGGRQSVIYPSNISMLYNSSAKMFTFT